MMVQARSDLFATGMLSSLVAKDRAAAEKPVSLFFGIPRTPEIDKIEVDVIQLRAAQVSVAQVGFADFLGVLELTVVEVVGVEAGTRAFRRSAAEDKAAAGRAHVEG